MESLNNRRSIRKYLSKDIKDYLVSIGLNKSLLDKDFISKIIKNQISKKGKNPLKRKTMNS